ncbi:MAG TPA: SRPBCC family protein [Actinomycetota bacterium]
MAEHAEGTISIDASPSEVMEVITDYEAYPEWAGVETVSVLERGPGDLATRVAFEVDVPVLGKASYTLAYRYAPGDLGLSWSTTEARGAVRELHGEYLLNEVDDDTEVTYRLSVELGVLVPAMLRTQGAKRVIDAALKGLKDRVENR